MNTDFSQSFDAREWASAFKAAVEASPSLATDEETLVAWFASAIMRGYDEHACKYPSDALVNAVGHYDLASKSRLHLGPYGNAVLDAALEFGRPHVDEDGIRLDVANRDKVTA